MVGCPRCHVEMRRLRRTSAQRLICSRLYRCDACAINVRWPHQRFRALANRLGWLLALHTTCVQCRGTAVRAVPASRARGAVTTMLEGLQRWVESSRYWCPRCNVSYYDCRPTESHRASYQPSHRGHAPVHAPKQAPAPRRRTTPAPELPPLVTIRIRKRRRAVAVAARQHRARTVSDERTHAPLSPVLGE